MTHKGGRLLSTLVCFLFSYLTLTNRITTNKITNEVRTLSMFIAFLSQFLSQFSFVLIIRISAASG